MRNVINQILDWWAQRMGVRAIHKQQKKFKKACQMADELLKTDNKTRYVIQRKGGYTILSTSDIDRLKAKRVFKSQVTIFTLLKQASYIATRSSVLKKEFDKSKK